MSKDNGPPCRNNKHTFHQPKATTMHAIASAALAALSITNPTPEQAPVCADFSVRFVATDANSPDFETVAIELPAGRYAITLSTTDTSQTSMGDNAGDDQRVL